MNKTYTFDAHRATDAGSVKVTLTQDEMERLLDMYLEEPESILDKLINFIDDIFPWVVIIGGSYLMVKIAVYVRGILF